jgi:hypothetical protein
VLVGHTVIAVIGQKMFSLHDKYSIDIYFNGQKINKDVLSFTVI